MQFKTRIIRFAAGCLIIGSTVSIQNGDCCADEKVGQQIFADQCASCHGVTGQGHAEHFPDPLQGDLALDELAKLISETMPEENPDECTGEQAAQVAKYVFDEFYSVDAQKKLRTPRVELSRLTVRQYRESVADLIGTFGESLWISEKRGIEGNYFAARNWTDNKRLAKQLDTAIDFGDGVPHFDPTGEYQSVSKKPKNPKKETNRMNEGFSVFWHGGVIAPETGIYEFVVESKNGFDLRVNDIENPLIDRRVRSDDVLEHQANVYLLGGRPYALKLDMFSYPDPPAKLRLLWKPPGGHLAVIPNSALIPHLPSEVLAVSTVFPADDASFGYERGVSVSEQWDAATTDAAIEAANWIAQRVWGLAKAEPTDDDAAQKAKEFCYKLVARAFAKQLTDEDRKFFVDQHFEIEISIEDQVKRVVIMTLKSPRFLFPTIQERDKEHELARRMALSLWDSVPDRRLFELAASRELLKPEIVSGELHRMVQDPRSRQKLHSFFHYWLKSDHAADASKDKELFPEFDDLVLADLKTSLELYLDDVVWTEESDFRELFLADYLYVNDRLANFYGMEVGEAGFQKVKVDPQERAGILTHPYLMSGLAYHKDSSPIHRGVFVAKQLLGRRLRQPPSDVKPLAEEFNPKMTTRERVEHQTKETACMNCHTVINPLGFSLENFDAVGRFRLEEKKKPIDVSTVYKTPDGQKVELNGARDLANFLANNETAQRSFVQQLFHHYAKQSIDAYGDDQLDRLHENFVEQDFNIQKLLVEIALVSINHGLE